MERQKYQLYAVVESDGHLLSLWETEVDANENCYFWKSHGIDAAVAIRMVNARSVYDYKPEEPIVDFTTANPS